MVKKEAMYYKQDWSEAQERMKAWWQGQILDRPIIQVIAPRRKPLNSISTILSSRNIIDQWTDEFLQLGPSNARSTPTVPYPQNLIDRWIDPQYRVNCAVKQSAITYFGGESYPFFIPYLGAGSLACYLGSSPRFLEDSIWYEPIDNWEDIPNLNFDPDNKWWRITQEFVRKGMEEGQGKFFVSFPDLIEHLDIVASLRGNSNLLYDLIDNPTYVHRCLARILDLWFQYYEEIYRITSNKQVGTADCLGIWAPGRMSKIQCDFSAMISPKMFEEFLVPYIRKQCQYLDYTYYHVDGPDAIGHLSALLDIPELNGIQWPPGGGNPSVGSSQWFPMYRRIQ